MAKKKKSGKKKNPTGANKTVETVTVVAAKVPPPTTPPSPPPLPLPTTTATPPPTTTTTTTTTATTVTTVTPEGVLGPSIVVTEQPTPAVISTLPPVVESSLSIFSEQQQAIIKLLCDKGQTHIFQHWEGAKDADKIAMATQLVSLDTSYPSGGLAGYIDNARDLLAKSKEGVNPLEGWKPSVPKGQAFEIGTEEYRQVEALGVQELGAVGFVLVAGGLGERLGYGDIKIGLPTELATGTCYLQFYIEYILALQNKFAGSKLLPLCIMTSNDTNTGTVKLLEDNFYFGMSKEQITIVQQGDGVPALLNNDAKISMDSPFKVATKPHGHGDIHALIYSNNVAKSWKEQGIKWITFFQDTNGLAFHTLPLALGVSTKYDLIMNSLTIPRKAKQAVGAITKLTNSTTNEERTINVEYNQLDPLLRANGSVAGDVNDASGFSPYPGNINQLLFAAEPYLAALERTKGAMPEFVNPKYCDAEKSVFKKPTRLECMMQDFPTILEGKDAERVGFTSIAANLSFSPVKNATCDGVTLQAQGTHPGVAATGEADQYGAVRLILKSIGVNIEEGDFETFNGITVALAPEIVVKPGIVLYPGEYKKLFPTPERIFISKKSSLTIKGSCDLIIESMNLDGALVIECKGESTCVLSNISVTNDGWIRVLPDMSASEVIAMRGYTLEKKETKTIVVTKDGVEGHSSVTPTVESEMPKVEISSLRETNEELAIEVNSEEPKVAAKATFPVDLLPSAPASLTEPSSKELAQTASESGCPCTIM